MCAVQLIYLSQQKRQLRVIKTYTINKKILKISDSSNSIYCNSSVKANKMLSYRRETALQGE